MSRRRRAAAALGAASVVALATLAVCAPASGEDHAFGVVVAGGQASAPTSQHFAEYGGVAVTRRLPLTGRLNASLELWPALVFHQTKRVDETTPPGPLPRETIYAAAAGGMLTFDVGRRAARWGLRLEGGAGVLWARHPVPAAGSSFNFLDQGGASIVFRRDGGRGRELSAGYRRVHVSNLGIAGDDNPGLSFHALVVAMRF